jgi:Mn-dependent DtxR family transcriptional regulator
MLTEQTRLDAFIFVSDNLASREKDVLNAIKSLGGRATMHQVAAYMNVPLNTISGRFSALFRKGSIVHGGIERPEGKRPRTIFMVKI